MFLRLLQWKRHRHAAWQELPKARQMGALSLLLALLAQLLFFLNREGLHGFWGGFLTSLITVMALSTVIVTGRMIRTRHDGQS